MFKCRYRLDFCLLRFEADPKEFYIGGFCRIPVLVVKNVLWLSEYELIEYENSKKAGYNPCFHSKYRIPRFKPWTNLTWTDVDVSHDNDHPKMFATVNGNDAATWADIWGVSPWMVAMDRHRVSTVSKSVNKICDPVFESIIADFERSKFDQDKIAASALYTMQRRETDLRKISILNFLIELKDFRSLFKNWDKLRPWWKNLLDLKEGKDDAETIAEQVLSINFAWRPLMQDLCQIFWSLALWRKKLKLLLAKLHKIRETQCRVKAYTYTPDADGPVFEQVGGGANVLCDGIPDWSGPSSWNVKMFIDQPVVPRAGMKYSLYCKPLSELQATVRGFLDTFNLSWDPGIIWNAIPFSFVIDWVYDVSRWLEHHGYSPWLPVELRLMDFYISWKYSIRFEVQMAQVSYGPKPDENGVNHFEFSHADRRFIVYCERFVRLKVTPTLEMLDLATWDKNVIHKTLLGASLVTTNTPRPKPIKAAPRRRKLRVVRHGDWLKNR